MTNSIHFSAASVLALSLVATAASAQTWQRDEVSPIWQQRQDLLTAWLGNAEPFVLDGATHMLHLENPRGLAERLAAFFADHPIR
jgi:pimeloyl-ACP methyl ester carboxylesterase